MAKRNCLAIRAAVDEHPTMNWRVEGADRETGGAAVRFVEASNSEQAMRRAARRGILSSHAEPLPDDLSDTPPNPLDAIRDDQSTSERFAHPHPRPHSHSQPPSPPYFRPPQQVQVIHHHHHEEGVSGGIAALLSFFVPGLGQMCSGRAGTGVLWLIFTFIGYIAFVIPGLILHIICIVTAASGRPRRVVHRSY